MVYSLLRRVLEHPENQSGRAIQVVVTHKRSFATPRWLAVDAALDWSPRPGAPETRLRWRQETPIKQAPIVQGQGHARNALYIAQHAYRCEGMQQMAQQ